MHDVLITSHYTCHSEFVPRMNLLNLYATFVVGVVVFHFCLCRFTVIYIYVYNFVGLAAK